MTKAFLTFAGRDYDRTRAIIDGRVSPKGVDLNYLAIDNPDEIFRRMLHNEEFDASELSLSSYMLARSKGRTSLMAIPVFPSRIFRHGYIFCNSDAGIREPRDLIGKKIGISEWQQTAGVWMRGMLQHEYDIPLNKIRWVRQREERQDFPGISSFTIDQLPKGSDINAMLISGEIDASMGAVIPRAIQERSPKLKRLFPDYQRLEVDYYKKTNLFPIMHTVVIRAALLKTNPWIAESLITAFNEAKEIAYQTIRTSGDKVSYVWAKSLLDEQYQVLGEDPYPYTLAQNRKTLETLMQYQVEQGILAEPMKLDDIFINSSRNT